MNGNISEVKTAIRYSLVVKQQDFRCRFRLSHVSAYNIGFFLCKQCFPPSLDVIEEKLSANNKTAGSDQR